jgi:hypothetical protein
MWLRYALYRVYLNSTNSLLEVHRSAESRASKIRSVDTEHNLQTQACCIVKVGDEESVHNA